MELPRDIGATARGRTVAAIAPVVDRALLRSARPAQVGDALAAVLADGIAKVRELVGEARTKRLVCMRALSTTRRQRCYGRTTSRNYAGCCCCEANGSTRAVVRSERERTASRGGVGHLAPAHARRLRGVPAPPPQGRLVHGERVRVPGRWRRARARMRAAPRRASCSRRPACCSRASAGAESDTLEPCRATCASASSTAANATDVLADRGPRVVDRRARAVVALDHAVGRAEALLGAVLRHRAAARPGAALRRSIETVDQAWVTPADAIARAGELALPPPQIRTFWELPGVRTDRRRDRRRRTRAPRSRIRSCRGSRRASPACPLLLPWDPDYSAARATGEAAPLTYHPTWATGPSRFVMEDRAWKHVNAPGSTPAASSSGGRARMPVLRGRDALLARAEPRDGRRACARCTASGSRSSRPTCRGASTSRRAAATTGRARATARVHDEAARERASHVVLRPGPHVNAELTSFGMPDCVLAEPDVSGAHAHAARRRGCRRHRARCRSRRTRATRFTRRSRAWYAAVADVGGGSQPDGRSSRSASTTRRRCSFASARTITTTTPTRSRGGASAPAATAARAGSRATPRACVVVGAVQGRTTSRARSARFASDARRRRPRRHRALPQPPARRPGLYDLPPIQAAIGGPVGIDAYTPRARFRRAAPARPRARRATRRRSRSASRSASASSRGSRRSIEADDPTARARPPADAARRRRRAASTCSWPSSAIATTARAIDAHGKVEGHAKWIAAADRHARRGRLAVAAAHRRDRARRLRAPTHGVGMATCAIDPMTPVVARGARPRARRTGRARHRRRRDRRTVAGRPRSRARSSSPRCPYAIVDEATPEDELAQPTAP